MIRKNGKILTTVYRKAAFSGQYVKWNSICHDSRKVHLIKTLTLRDLRICSPSLLELELNFIKSVFLENDYPLEVIQSSIRDVQLQQKKEPVFGPEKCPVYLKLPCIGMASNWLRTAVHRLYIIDITIRELW